jgi:hypothetical protein
VTNAEHHIDGRAGNKPMEKRTVNVIPTVRSSETEVIPSDIAPSFARQNSLVSSQRSFVSNASRYQHTGQVDDIDARDAEDPLCATAFVQDMYEYFRVKEISSSVPPTYMDAQPHINERMRSILVDWLVEVHLKFKLVPETLYLCVNIIDRFLALQEVSRPKLQLLGVTALLVAAKYEEICTYFHHSHFQPLRFKSQTNIHSPFTQTLRNFAIWCTFVTGHTIVTRSLKWKRRC